MSHQTPRVTIGLPVYNGQAFLGEALDSLLAQTFPDFELIISDNASTDATADICRRRAQADPRVRYVRNETNVGGRLNFNRVAEMARGEYFKWAAHDDVHEAAFLERCVAVLDARPDVALVYPAARDIDESGRTLRTVKQGLRSDDPDPAVRFRELIRRTHSCVAIFGVVRTAALRQTRLLANYADCDRVLLAEIGLGGRVVEIPEPLFVHRQHVNRSVWQYRSRQRRSAWFDPKRGERPVWPYTRQFVDYHRAIRRAPVPLSTKMACQLPMVKWVRDNFDGLREDVSYAVRYVLRPVKRRLVPGTRAEAPAQESGERSETCP